MARLLLIFVLSTILAVKARPKCVYDDTTFRTTCTPGETSYNLDKGLVSNNKETTSISLKGCKISGIGLDAFHGLPRLTHLDLSQNQIQTLELGVLDNLKEVTHLNLSHNQLTKFPLGLFDESTRLELLDLKGNKLTEFELGIFDPLPRLGHLDLSSNNFFGRYLSPYLFDKSKYITFIDFSGNDMRDTPENLLSIFRTIRFLNLSGCSLVDVPKFATLSNLGTMNELMLINNFITSIDDPNTFSNLVNLEKINLAGNPIRHLNKDVFKPLKKLKSVVISGGKLKEIPESVFKGLNKLTKVDLSYNLIEFVPVDAFRETNLRNLNLNNNRFSYLTDNFVLELSNSGVNLVNFQFANNPWQCACLRDIMKEVKSKNVKYNTDKYDGKYKVCVTKDFTCKRQRMDNDFFVNLYFNSI